MPRTQISQSTRHRILRSARDRPPEEVREPARRDPAAPPPSRRIALGGRGRGRRNGGSFRTLAVAKLILLALVVVSGTAVIVWLRTLAEAFGVNWIGE